MSYGQYNYAAGPTASQHYPFQYPEEYAETLGGQTRSLRTELLSPISSHPSLTPPPDVPVYTVPNTAPHTAPPPEPESAPAPAPEPESDELDPARGRSSRHRGPSARFQREREQVHASAAATEVLASLIAKEYECLRLRKYLKHALARLAADDARVSEAERVTQHALDQLRAVTDAKLAAERMLAGAQEQLRMWKFQHEHAQQEIVRAQSVVKLVEEQKEDAERDAAAARSSARKLQHRVLVAEAMEEGRRLGYDSGLRMAQRELELLGVANATKSKAAQPPLLMAPSRPPYEAQSPYRVPPMESGEIEDLSDVSDDDDDDFEEMLAQNASAAQKPAVAAPQPVLAMPSPVHPAPPVLGSTIPMSARSPSIQLDRFPIEIPSASVLNDAPPPVQSRRPSFRRKPKQPSPAPKPPPSLAPRPPPSPARSAVVLPPPASRLPDNYVPLSTESGIVLPPPFHLSQTLLPQIPSPASEIASAWTDLQTNRAQVPAPKYNYRGPSPDRASSYVPEGQQRATSSHGHRPNEHSSGAHRQPVASTHSRRRSEHRPGSDADAFSYTHALQVGGGGAEPTSGRNLRRSKDKRPISPSSAGSPNYGILQTDLPSFGAQMHYLQQQQHAHVLEGFIPQSVTVPAQVTIPVSVRGKTISSPVGEAVDGRGRPISIISRPISVGSQRPVSVMNPRPVSVAEPRPATPARRPVSELSHAPTEPWHSGASLQPDPLPPRPRSRVSMHSNVGPTLTAGPALTRQASRNSLISNSSYAHFEPASYVDPAFYAVDGHGPGRGGHGPARSVRSRRASDASALSGLSYIPQAPILRIGLPVDFLVGLHPQSRGIRDFILRFLERVRRVEKGAPYLIRHSLSVRADDLMCAVVTVRLHLGLGPCLGLHIHIAPAITKKRPRQMLLLQLLSPLFIAPIALSATQHPFKAPVPPTTPNKIITPEIDAWVTTQLARWNSTGLSLAVVRKDAAQPGRWAVEFGSYGFARQGVPVRPDTLFAVASDSKLFTAVAVGLLVANETLAGQRGRRVRWDTPIGELLPEWGLWDARAAQVTLQDMLTHRTGIPRHEYSGQVRGGGLPEMISTLRHLRPSASLRDRYQYNNLMFEALAHLPPTLLNQTFESYVEQHLFKPLGMDSATYSVREAEAGGRLAHGHHWDMRDYSRNITGTRVPIDPYFLRPGEEVIWRGAAGVLVSVRDMAMWAGMLMNEGRHPLTNATIVPKEVIEHISAGVSVVAGKAVHPEQSPKLYACARVRYSYRGHEILEHGGSNPGFKSQFTQLTNNELAIIAMSNDDRGVPLTEGIKWRILDSVMGLEPLDWNSRFENDIENEKRFRGLGTMVPRPSHPEPASLPFTEMLGVFSHAAYGPFSPCLFDAPTSCSDPAVERMVRFNASLHPAPTFVVPFKRTLATHLLFTHFSGNTFNVSVIWSNTQARLDAGYPAGGDVVVGFDERHTVEWVGGAREARSQHGWAFGGNFWGAEGGYGEVVEGAEAWFGRVA
ncbi:unnamed protein product [Mycena citricolor]|uniref:Beta-lactamase-related domain-containing protein n=1 Tax=Mycena citricolor TaxID=2018698 RepID=A0AAD2HWG4_9AGAR|nr:unnamed protein product [Mycena citricolor]